MTQYPQRKSPRLQGYDYTQNGAYFITICTFQRTLLFGDVVDDTVQLTEMGQIAHHHVALIPQHFPHVIVDEYVIMPNHVHMILFLIDEEQRTASLQIPAKNDKYLKPGAIGTIIRSYKSAITRRINQIHPDTPLKIWQSRYHDHIIRDEKSLNYIRRYVQYNPAKWTEDSFYGN